MLSHFSRAWFVHSLRSGDRSTHDTGECNDFNASCTCPPQGGGGGIRGCAAREDVVDEDDARRCRPDGGERACDVPPSLGAREPPLRAHRPGTTEQSLDGEVPAVRERLGEPTWRIVPSPQPAVGVGRNEGQHPGRLRNDLEHQFCGGYNQPA
jgi:hypothetical protein